ncbi:mechanosensitive ion channel family protein [Kytococcus schroeteri]|uniref:mechanosensitive ion channel family protein n=1 Tax=Kytococcus schroeteri TaxID=138300 RepID=UPI0035E6F03C
MVRWVLRACGRGASAVRVFGSIVGWAVALLALGVAFTMVFPSIKPVDIIGGIGIVSIAAGIAFQTVLGTMFAGIVILARDRFNVGDQVHVGDVRGTVEDIGLSSTVIRSFDSRQLLLPNSLVPSQVVTVQTGYERVRTTVTVDLDLATDQDRAREVALAAMLSVPQVHADPAPQVLAAEVVTGAVTTELPFWSGARQLETREAKDAVIRAVLRAFAAEGIGLVSAW